MVHTIRAQGKRREHLHDEARRKLTALAANFGDPVETLTTARALVEGGELEIAHRLYRHGRKLGPDDVNAELEHAEVLRRLGRMDEARAILEETTERLAARRDVSTLALVECRLGEIHRDMGELGRAMRIAERWLTHREVWDVATFLWVDCVTLAGRSLDRAVKLAVERGNASPAMFHAVLQEMFADDGDPRMGQAILAIGDETLFTGWLDAIPDLRRLVERRLAPVSEAALIAT
jgi:tetratricopeptide (TPR) repeat protein